MKHRHVMEIIPARRTSDGDGVKISRIVGQRGMKDLDPFLLLDEINSDESKDYIGGFPPHPHRGFETITYMRKGSFRHEDHLGNNGLVSTGGAQWMTAGSGVIHSEMPEQDEGELHGFQLWLNLPAREKMQKARYRDIQADSIPVMHTEAGAQIKVIGGTLELEGKRLEGPIKGRTTKPVYWDVNVPESEEVDLPLSEEYTAYLYVYHGDLEVAGRNIEARSFVRLSSGDVVKIRAKTEADFLLLAGKAIREPIANYGPFVMNTHEEIEQAFKDYQSGTLTDEQHVVQL